jgi:hypothetical protein
MQRLVGSGRSIGPEFLIGSFLTSSPLKTAFRSTNLWVDYGFAFLFGIFFQYFPIAPMSGDYGSKSLSRITKANFLSLAFFEIGPFGWMDIFQLAIF